MIDRRQWFNRVVLAATESMGGSRKSSASVEPTPPLPFSDQVAQILEKTRKANRRIPGMAAAIVRGDRVVGNSADGVRKVGSPEAIEVGDRFHLGSCTKAMTATMIGAVVDSEKLRWDSTLASVFPNEAAEMHPGYRGVTLDQLLDHRAGLPANVDWWGVPEGMSPMLQRRSLLTSSLKDAPKTTPGSAFGYSNVGYVLAASMAEEVSATPWEDSIRGLVFDPLGMTSAGFGPPGSDQAVDQPWGHTSLGPLFLPTRIDNPPVMGPAGSVHASVGDWAKFASFHLGDGSVNGRRILSSETLRKLHTPGHGHHYSGGWIVSNHRTSAAGPTWEHAGSNTVWFALIALAPRHQFAALAATNAGGKYAEVACMELVDGLLALESMTRG